jgi:iron complex outermembrane recepter protein
MKFRKFAVGLTVLFASNVYAEALYLDSVTVSATREIQKLSQSPNSITQVTEEDFIQNKPQMLSEIGRRMPGVYFQPTAGISNFTSIRMPNVNSPVYLYTEDGIPIRSAGFYNPANQIDLDIPHYSGLDIIKGPASALYGSEAIGAVLNFKTRQSPSSTEFDVTQEVGSFGWKRFLGTGGTGGSDWGIRGNVNLTSFDGYRDDHGVDAKNFSVRIDKGLANDAILKTYIAYTKVDQNGSSGMDRVNQYDYINNPKVNYVPIARKNQEALRMHAAYEQEIGRSLISITPYFRYNSIDQIPNFGSLTSLINSKEHNYSFGVQSKLRRDFDTMQSRVIVGLDIDRSPGKWYEDALTTTSRTLDSGAKQYYAYTVNANANYNYDVVYSSISPYAQTEFNPISKIPLRITAGVRYDWMQYQYDNNLSVKNTGCANTNGNKCRPEDQTLSWDNVSAKIGGVYDLNQNHNVYANYAEGFRAPRHTDLFQQGGNASSTNLKPTESVQKEVGLRGKLFDRVNYTTALFTIDRENDTLAYRGADNAVVTSSNGKTSHKGIEIGLSTKITDSFSVIGNYSYTKHKYEQWLASASTGSIDYSGKNYEQTPKELANLILNYKPHWLNGGRTDLEFVHVGDIWMDQSNTQLNSGFNIVNLRANYFINKSIEVHTRVLNLTDKKYSNNPTYLPAGNEYTPADPRSVFVGVSYHFK